MAFPPKKKPGEEDTGAVMALMTESPEEEATEEVAEGETPRGDPMQLVTELQAKIEELKQAIG